MKKNALMKIGNDVLRIKKAVKITSAAAMLSKLVLAAMLVFTALDAYSVVKKTR